MNYGRDKHDVSTANKSTARNSEWIRGMVKSINTEKRYGYITPIDTSVCDVFDNSGRRKDVFFMLDTVANDWLIKINEMVDFQLYVRGSYSHLSAVIIRRAFSNGESLQRTSSVVDNVVIRQTDIDRIQFPSHTTPGSNLQIPESDSNDSEEEFASRTRRDLDNFRKSIHGRVVIGIVDDLDWDQMPLVPSVQELISGPFESSTSSASVQTVGPYASAREYVSIFFKRLRAEVFSALSKGVHDLLNGKLDPRDMNVYTNIKFAGVQMAGSECGLSMALTITPSRGLINREQSTDLLFGNLLCISVTGTFRDPIWATVVKRDLLETHQMVIIDLCSESNSISDSEAIQSLYFMSASTIMVESSTYYRAYQPVLKYLQTMDPEELAFREELVYCQSGGCPETICERSEFPAKVIYPRCLFKIRASSFSSNLIYGPSSLYTTVLGDTQIEAIQKCLRCRVAIVQGPPGTGKTLVGLKIVQILLSMTNSPENVPTVGAMYPGVNSQWSDAIPSSDASQVQEHTRTKPIIIITNRSHSLDEFLIEALKMFPGQVARVGGISQNQIISDCSLDYLVQNKFKMPADVCQRVTVFESRLEYLKGLVKSRLDSLMSTRYFTVESFVEYLSCNQITSFLRNCRWSDARVRHFSCDISNDEGDQNGEKLVKQEDVEEILTWCQDKNIHQELICRELKGSLGAKLYILLQAALKQWLPHISEFVKFEESYSDQNKICYSFYSNSEDIENNSEKTHLKTTINVGETDVEDILQERLAAMTISKENSIVELFKSIKTTFEELKVVTAGKHSDATPYLMKLAKELSKKIPWGLLLGVKNIWKLVNVDIIKLVQCLLYRQFESERESFDKIFTEYLKLYREKEEFECQYRVSILKKMKVVGMTITSANFHHHLLSRLRPEVVIVEEAAEIQEPQLIAVIGNWVQHLIIIGDHHQLKPSVRNLTLIEHCNLDLSMMKRLINNNLPHTSLTMQYRMRPEFANLLLDVYPTLTSNRLLTENIRQANCIVRSMYFWNHEEPESGCNFTNVEEAERAVRLALFLIIHGNAPEVITILSPFLEQVRLIREKIEESKMKILNLLKISNCETFVRVHTIDSSKGRVNDFVIISLVRSNKRHKVGLAGVLNRQCVAQSMSRRGLYFIGNSKTFSRSNNWKPLLDQLHTFRCIGSTLYLHCPIHSEVKLLVHNAADIPVFESFCKGTCKQFMPCKKHYCNKACHPRHSHESCETVIKFTCKTCCFVGKRRCSQAEKDAACTRVEKIGFPFCAHYGYRKCHQKSSDVECDQMCSRNFLCGHKCFDSCTNLCNRALCSSCTNFQKSEKPKSIQIPLAWRNEYIKRIDLKIIKMNERLEQAVIKRTILSKSYNTAREYFDIEDRVKLFVHSDQHWFPEVTLIEKIINHELESRWLKIRMKLHDPSNHSFKFQEVNKEEVERITTAKFLVIPPTNKSTIGKGMKFFSSSLKKYAETKGTNMLLVSEVLIGKALVNTTAAMPNVTLSQLNAMGYDSIWAQRKPNKTDEAFADVYVVLSPDQVLPTHIVHFRTIDYRNAKLAAQLEDEAVASNTCYKKYKLIQRREAQSDDPYQFHFNVAESQFRRLMKMNNLSYVIESVDYHINLSSIERFKSATIAMKQKYCKPDDASKCEYTLEFCSVTSNYVETIMRPANDAILKLLEVDGSFGSGMYFSSCPDVIQGSGNARMKSLLLCKVLAGNTQNCKTGREVRQVEYDSLRFIGDEQSVWKNELVVFDVDKILPIYVINFR